VKDIMTEVVEALRVGDSLDLADRIMRVGRIRHLPVVDGDDHLVGLVTHRTLLAAWVSHGSPGSERISDVARDIPIEMVMVKDVLTTTPEASAADAARILEKHKYGCLPVVSRRQAGRHPHRGRLPPLRPRSPRARAAPPRKPASAT
jgi:CBS domain-containing membrane protein